MFSMVQHLLYRVDPMADSYEMNHMVVNTNWVILNHFNTPMSTFEKILII